jgi:hypothetical protein
VKLDLPGEARIADSVVEERATGSRGASWIVLDSRPSLLATALLDILFLFTEIKKLSFGAR